MKNTIMTVVFMLQFYAYFMDVNIVYHQSIINIVLGCIGIEEKKVVRSNVNENQYILNFAFN